MPNPTPIDLSIDGRADTLPADNLAAEEPAARPKRDDAPRQSGRRRPKPSQQPDKPRRNRGQRSFFAGVAAFVRNPRTAQGAGFLLTVLAIVLCVMTFSYLKNGAADQSIVAGATMQQLVERSADIQNAGGALGAKTSHVLFVDGLGAGSLVLVVYIACLGLGLLNLLRIRFWPFTFKCLFTAIAVSVIAGLLTYNAETAFHWGGNHGRYVNRWLYDVSDVLGQYAVTVALAGLLVIMYLTQLKRFYDSVSGRIVKARALMAAQAAEGRRGNWEYTDAPDDSDTAAAPVGLEADDNAGHTSPIPPSPLPDAPAKAPIQATADIGGGITGFNIDEPAAPAMSLDSAIAPAPLRTATAPQPAPVPQPVAEAEAAELAPAPAPAAVADNAEPAFNINERQGELADTVDSPAAAPAPAEMEPYDHRADLSRYHFPGTDLLIERPAKTAFDADEQQENKDLIVKTLRDYRIPISRIEATIGPTVTLYEIVPAEGVRIAQIKRLEDDIALSLAALGIRIIAPIPGKGTVGIEVPNRDPQTVSIFSVLASRKFRECKMALPMALGATIANDIFIADLTRMPHLLVAGATGQGKSVGLNCIIASLLYKKHPSELKFVLIDPKMVEFSLYSRIDRHFLAKLPDEEDVVVTDPSKALATLNSLCVEMDNRYELLKNAGARNLEEYNHKFATRVLSPEKGHRYMPYIVMVVDEFADLIMTAGKEISLSIARIAQKARAVGMHMIIATQRPSTDVITGMIKANFPGRIAFRVASMVDSKTILDRPGANRLIGRGDMLFSHNGTLERVQCAFIDTPEVDAIVEFISGQVGYDTPYLLPEPQNEGGALAPGAVDTSKLDDMFNDCARFVVTNATASTSSLQRRFGIGYNKAGKIMDQMEALGIVGPADGAKPRAVLIDSIALEDIIRNH